MINIAIIDDDEGQLKLMRSYIDRFSSDSEEDLSCMTYSDGLSFISGYKGNADIIFMDIEMKVMGGMEAAKILRKIDENVILIFVTRLAQYAVKGYEVNALDFLVKPVNYFTFAMKMKRAVKAVKQKKGVQVFVPCGGGSAKVLNSSSIHYIEVIGHNLIYHTSEGSFQARGSLQNLQELLTPASFCLCHRCFLINPAFVSTIGEEGITIDGTLIPVSRLKKKEVFSHLSNYFGRNI